jgi:hypothetical protein
MTVLTESFNKADADTLGPDQTWVEDLGDIDVVSSRAQHTTGTTFARVTTSLATDDHYVQATVRANTDGDCNPGVAARKEASATLTFYMVDAKFSDNLTRLFRAVNNSFTSIGSDIGTTFASNTDYLLRLEVNGDNVKTFVDGTPKHDLTDTTISGNLQCGIRGDTTGGIAIMWDNWEAGDIVPSVIPVSRVN